MFGLRIFVLLVTLLSSCSAYPRLPYQQGPSGQVSGPDGRYQSTPPFASSASRKASKSQAASTGTRTSVGSFGPTSTGTTGNGRPTYLYGVNAGGHLIVEKWMTPDLFQGTNATDQWTLDQTDGAQAKLKTHWDTYYTKQDFAAMKKWGLNAVRIPIGFWAYDNKGTPYQSGADVYLERMIGWCRELGLWVLVDCHGSPGSQNGFDNSGRSGDAKWQTGDNLDRSVAVLETMAKKYGSKKYSDVVYGLQLVNEPISWNGNKLEVTQEWTKKAYQKVRDAAENKDLVIVMHDGFMTPSKWVHVGKKIIGDRRTMTTAGFAVDTHLYQNQEQEDKSLTQTEHIAKACNWTTTKLLPQNNGSLPVLVGEFSAATDICANPDGSTVAGSTCSTDGCQCANNVDIKSWNQPLKDATRKFFEAELEAFEKGAQGWFIWSWKGPGGWGMENLVREGIVGQGVKDRKFKGQCN